MTAERAESANAPTIADLCVVIARGDEEQSKSARDALQARLVETRETCVELAEKLHRTTIESVARAEEALAEFDRQSEAALAESSQAVEKARRKLQDAEQRGAASGDRLADLEAGLRLAQANDLIVLRERSGARAQHEAVWRSEAMAAVTCGVLLSQALRIDAGMYGGRELAVRPLSPREFLEQIDARGRVYPFPPAPNGSTHHDAAPAEARP